MLDTYIVSLEFIHTYMVMSVANSRRASNLVATAEKSYTSNISHNTDSAKLIFK